MGNKRKNVNQPVGIDDAGNSTKDMHVTPEGDIHWPGRKPENVDDVIAQGGGGPAIRRGVLEWLLGPDED